MSTAVFFGRCNLPTPAHAALIRNLCSRYDNVYIYLSDNCRCTDLGQRVTVLWDLVGVQPNLSIDSASSMYRAFEAHADQEEVYFCGGEDREADITTLANRFGVNYHIFSRGDGISSTLMRELIDAKDWEALSQFYTEVQLTQVIHLRYQELA